MTIHRECVYSGRAMLRLFAFLIGLLSWKGAQRVGSALGLVWFHLVRIRRRVVLENLALVLPGSRTEHLKIARESYRHFGISAMEFLKLRSLRKDEIVSHVRAQGMENYEKARVQGRGIIVITAHFGNFDLLACSQAAQGIPLAIVSRELHRGSVSRFWMKTRQASGLEIFPDKGSARQILTWLRSGKVLGLTVDQRTPPERGGVRVDFMGAPAWTMTAPAALALRTGAVLLPVRIERLQNGEHNVVIEEEIPIAKLGRKEGVREVTEQINRAVAGWVERRPDQWMWLHRRFVDSSKTGP